MYIMLKKVFYAVDTNKQIRKSKLYLVYTLGMSLYTYNVVKKNCHRNASTTQELKNCMKKF